MNEDWLLASPTQFSGGHNASSGITTGRTAILGGQGAAGRDMARPPRLARRWREESRPDRNQRGRPTAISTMRQACCGRLRIIQLPVLTVMHNIARGTRS